MSNYLKKYTYCRYIGDLSIFIFCKGCLVKEVRVKVSYGKGQYNIGDKSEDSWTLFKTDKNLHYYFP